MIQGPSGESMYFDDDEYNVTPPPRRRFWTSRRLVVPRRDAEGRRIIREQGPLPSELEADYLTPEPEDFLPSPPKPPGPLSQRPDLRYARPALMMFALFFAASFVHWSDPQHSPFAAARSLVLQEGEWWRLLTALFTHSDMDHLASNTPLFLIFGWFLHAYFGWLAFPLGALVVGMLSNLATIGLMGPGGRLVGASGMLYGMVALWLMLYVKFDVQHPVPVRIFRAIAVSLLLLFPTTFHPTTSYTAHATGFAIGVVAGALLTRVVTVRAPIDGEAAAGPHA